MKLMQASVPLCVLNTIVNWYSKLSACGGGLVYCHSSLYCAMV